MRLREFLFGSLRRQLIFGVAVVHAVMMSLFVWDLTERQQDMLLDRQAEQAQALAQTLATSAAGWLAARDISGLQELAEAQRRYPQLAFAMLLDREGQVLAHTERARQGQYVRDLPQEARLTLLARGSALVDAIAPAMLAGHAVGWARVGIGQQEAQEKLAAITRNGVLYALAAIAIGSILALLMGNRLTRKLYAMRRVSETVRAGHQEMRVPDLGGDEAGQLARDFNAMLDALSSSEKRLTNIVSLAADAIISVDHDQRILIFNQGAERIFGYTAKEVAGQPLDMLLPAGFAGAHREHIRRFAAGPDAARAINQRGEIHGRRKNGTEFPAEASISKFVENNETSFTVILRDITERKDAEARLSYLAHYDTLTGLPNRVLLYDRLNQAMTEADRNDRLVAVMFLDLDRFKIINDTLGHDVGDVLLKSVAERMAGCVRTGDTISRLGGDEFTVVLAKVAHVDDVARVAQKIIDSFVPPFNIDGRELFMSPSIGITLYPFDDNNLESLLRNADAAMYHAKEMGRNTFRFYTAELNQRTAKRLALETALRHAIERHELLLHYQPQVNLRTGRITGMEALLRWQHPEMGLIPPLDFIPLAEETGLIIPIGEWVLRTACAQARAWRDAGFRNLQMAVNISGRQFQHRDLAKLVKKVLKETGLNPRYLDLELTESLLMHNTGETLTAMDELHTYGVAFSMDDFGTGYSSLSYLKRFPIDTLKIDQSFVRDIPRDPDDAAIAQAIIAMAHGLGIKVIAEGVETGKQLAFMRANKCDGMQGYYFSKPVPAEKMTGLLQKDHSTRRKTTPRGKTSSRKKK